MVAYLENYKNIDNSNNKNAVNMDAKYDLKFPFV